MRPDQPRPDRLGFGHIEAGMARDERMHPAIKREGRVARRQMSDPEARGGITREGREQRMMPGLRQGLEGGGIGGVELEALVAQAVARIDGKVVEGDRVFDLGLHTGVVLVSRPHRRSIGGN